MTVRTVFVPRCLAALLTLLPAAAFSQASAPGNNGIAPPKPAGIAIELNKLESVPNACRGYFIVENGSAEGVKELKIDVFLFDRSGTILRRVALTFSDIRPNRTKVVLFDLAEASCAEVGRLLLNDVLACNGNSGTPIANCPELLSARTRAGVEFRY